MKNTHNKYRWGLGILILIFVGQSCSSTKGSPYRIASNKEKVRYTHAKTGARSTANNASSSKNLNTSQALIRYAQNQLGTKYVYGGKTPKGFDCSGFTSYVYNKVGYKISPSSRLQSKEGRKIKLKNVQSGDLIFFGKNGKVSHVGIVVKSSTNTLEVIHATTSKGVMQQDVLSSKYWAPKILFARRYI